MSVVARRVRATPKRSAAETWRFILELVSAPGTEARQELEAAGGVAACLIADETPKEAPIVVAGCGPRLRIYCLYGEEAVTGEGSNETNLTWDSTEGEWTMWLPAAAEDIAWVSAELGKCGKRIIAYNPKEEEAGRTATPGGRTDLGIEVEEFKKL